MIFLLSTLSFPTSYSQNVFSQDRVEIDDMDEKLPSQLIMVKGAVQKWALQKALVKPHRNHKVNAILLAVALGPFGVHRLYLGTHPRVPVIYTLTLGGGLGILPLADIIALLATDNIEQYMNNDKVIMWAK